MLAEDAVESSPPAANATQGTVAVVPQDGDSRPAEFLGAPAVDAASLDTSRGGAETVILNDINSTGTVHGNQASNLTTGSNYLADGAFAGASGFSTVLQNTGNNVLIQNSTIINMQLK
ncbi:MAG: hypothetical protein WBP72_13600 [Rhodocyclaceae bacterium]